MMITHGVPHSYGRSNNPNILKSLPRYKHTLSYQDMDMGYLPPSLCMMELATRIDQNAMARVS